jgi:acyl dehydratase
MTERQAQRYWDDVNEGDDVPGYSMKLDWTRMVRQVSGTQDYYQVHHDPEFARESGHPEIFINTGFYQSSFSRLLNSYVGDDGWLRKFKMDMRAPNYLGDIVTFKGTVARKYRTEEGAHALDLEVWAENERGVTTPALATVYLPAR